MASLNCNYIDQSTWVRWASSSERVSLAVRGRERLDMTQDSRFWHNLARPGQESLEYCFILGSSVLLRPYLWGQIHTCCHKMVT